MSKKAPVQDVPDGWDDDDLETPDWLAGLDHPKKWLTPLYLAASEYYELAEVEDQIAGLRDLIANRPEVDGGSILGDEDEAAEQLAELVERRDVLRPVVRESEKKIRVQNALSSDELRSLFKEHTGPDGVEEDNLMLDLLRTSQVEPRMRRDDWKRLQRAVGIGQWEQFKAELIAFLNAEAVRPDFSQAASGTNPD